MRRRRRGIRGRRRGRRRRRRGIRERRRGRRRRMRGRRRRRRGMMRRRRGMMRRRRGRRRSYKRWARRIAVHLSQSCCAKPIVPQMVDYHTPYRLPYDVELHIFLAINISSII